MEPNELTIRAVTLVDAPADERIIEARIAPLNARTEIFPGVAETFLPGSFSGDQNAGRIAVKLETGSGHSGPVIGRLTDLEERSDGAYGILRISETPDGDDALALARDGALGISIGFLIGEDGATRSISDGVETTAISAVDLREVTLTGTPVYQNAEPISVRSTIREDPEIMENENTVETPDVAEMIRSAVDTAVDEIRAAAVAPPPVVEAEARGHEYRNVGELMRDTIAHARRKSPDASERLTRSIDVGLVEADGSAINLRAFTAVGNSVGDSTPNNVYVPDLLELLREGRPVADLFSGRGLPVDGNTIQLPQVSTGNTVGYQDGEGTTVDEQAQQWILNDFAKATIAGGQGVTLQAAQWSNPSYMDEVVRDLVAGYGEFLDWATINGDPVVDTPVSGTGHTGILNAGATDIPAVGSPDVALGLVGAGWAAVYAGSRRSPVAAMMNSAVWCGFLDLADTDSRPLISTEVPQNPAGFGNAASIAGTLRSIPVVLDDNIDPTMVILGSFRDALLYEDQGTPAQIALTYPDVLVTDVAVYGFSAVAIRRGAAFAVLSGITV